MTLAIVWPLSSSTDQRSTSSTTTVTGPVLAVDGSTVFHDLVQPYVPSTGFTDPARLGTHPIGLDGVASERWHAVSNLYGGSAVGYSEQARELRRCKALRNDGEPCRAFAAWDDPQGCCTIHAGRHFRGVRMRFQHAPHRQARYKPCTCRAYAWPHKPGGGGCNWPDAPRYMLLTPAGMRREW
jgi:hypothetical protein